MQLAFTVTQATGGLKEKHIVFDHSPQIPTCLLLSKYLTELLQHTHLERNFK